MADQSTPSGIGADQLLARMPKEVADSMTPEQRTALRRAADERIRSQTYPVNIRISLSLPFAPFFLSIIAGRERRNPSRLANERFANPLMTSGNLVLLAAAVGALLLAAAAGGLTVAALG
ncbi:MAG: hypothetical protein WCF16_10555 [Alphaproteobacteria bacterium]